MGCSQENATTNSRPRTRPNHVDARSHCDWVVGPVRERADHGRAQTVKTRIHLAWSSGFVAIAGVFNKKTLRSTNTVRSRTDPTNVMVMAVSEPHSCVFTLRLGRRARSRTGRPRPRPDRKDAYSPGMVVGFCGHCRGVQRDNVAVDQQGPFANGPYAILRCGRPPRLGQKRPS